jgi:hypothetical protein
MVGRNRPHRVPTKQRPIAPMDRVKLCGSSKSSPVTHASEPEKTVPTYAG